MWLPFSRVSGLPFLAGLGDMVADAGDGAEVQFRGEHDFRGDVEPVGEVDADAAAPGVIGVAVSPEAVAVREERRSRR